MNAIRPVCMDAQPDPFDALMEALAEWERAERALIEAHKEMIRDVGDILGGEDV